VAGIIGGLGPEATVELMSRIIHYTGAKKDQDHLHLIVDHNPKIPDRSAAIRRGGESPLPLLRAAARRLEKAGADFIVIPCNTAHFYLPRIRRSVRLPVVDLIAEAVRCAQAKRPAVRRVGLLATSGTVTAGVYRRACLEAGLELVTPPAARQKLVVEAIYLVKSGRGTGRAAAILARAARFLATEQGAEVVIAGCTEIPLVLKQAHCPVPLVDSLDVLARRTVALATLGWQCGRLISKGCHSRG